jgi:hypothetical protein
MIRGVNLFRPVLSVGIAVILSTQTLLASWADAQKRPQLLSVTIIQDVHLNFEAQRHITLLLSDMAKQKKISWIGVEGAFAPFNFQPFYSFDADIINRIADDLLEQNRISAPSYIGLKRQNGTVPILGVDDPRHYKNHVNALKKAEQSRPAKSKLLQQKKELQQHQKIIVLNPTLKNLDDLSERFHNKELELGEFLRSINGNESTSPHIQNFLTAFFLENSLNIDQAKHEYSLFINRLATMLSQHEKTLLFQQSALNPGSPLLLSQHINSLEKIASQKDIPLSSYPEFQKFSRYTKTSALINAQQLLKDVNDYEKKRLNSAAITIQEKKLVNQILLRRLQERLIEFSLTDSEWKDYQTLSSEKHDFLEFEDFYREADIRSDKMIKNIRSLNGHGVLIMGGFHTNRATDILKQNNIPFNIITPKITHIETHDGVAYLSSFSQEKTPLDRIFQNEKLFLNPAGLHLGAGRTAQGISNQAYLAAAMETFAATGRNPTALTMARFGNTITATLPSGEQVSAIYDPTLASVRAVSHIQFIDNLPQKPKHDWKIMSLVITAGAMLGVNLFNQFSWAEILMLLPLMAAVTPPSAGNNKWALLTLLQNRLKHEPVTGPITVTFHKSVNSAEYSVRLVKSKIKNHLNQIIYDEYEDIGFLPVEQSIKLLTRGITEWAFTIPKGGSLDSIIGNLENLLENTREGWELSGNPSVPDSIISQRFDKSIRSIAPFLQDEKIDERIIFSKQGLLLEYLHDRTARQMVFSYLANEKISTTMLGISRKLLKSKKLHPTDHDLVIKSDILHSMQKELLSRLAEKPSIKIKNDLSETHKKLVGMQIHLLEKAELNSRPFQTIAGNLINSFAFSESLDLEADDLLWRSSQHRMWKQTRKLLKEWKPASIVQLKLDALTFLPHIGYENWQNLISELFMNVASKMGSETPTTYDYQDSGADHLEKIWIKIDSSENSIWEKAFYQAGFSALQNPELMNGLFDFATQSTTPGFMSRVLNLIAVIREISQWGWNETQKPFPYKQLIHLLRSTNSQFPINDIRSKRFMFSSIFSRLPASMGLPADSVIMEKANGHSQAPDDVIKSGKTMDLDQMISWHVRFIGINSTAKLLISNRLGFLKTGNVRLLENSMLEMKEHGWIIAPETKIPRNETSIAEQTDLLKLVEKALESEQRLSQGLRQQSRSDLDINENNIDEDIYDLNRLIHRTVHRKSGALAINLVEARLEAWRTGDYREAAELCKDMEPRITKTWYAKIKRKSFKGHQNPIAVLFFNAFDNRPVKDILKIEDRDLEIIQTRLHHENPGKVKEISIFFDREIELYRALERRYNPQRLENAMQEIESLEWPENAAVSALMKSIREKQPVVKQVEALLTLRKKMALLLHKQLTRFHHKEDDDKPTYGIQHGVRGIYGYLPSDPVFKLFLLDLRLNEIETTILEHFNQTVLHQENFHSRASALVVLIDLLETIGWASLPLKRYRDVLKTPDLTPERLALVCQKIIEVLDDYDRWEDREVGGILDAASGMVDYFKVSRKITSSMKIDDESDFDKQRARIRTHVQRLWATNNNPVHQLRKLSQGAFKKPGNSSTPVGLGHRSVVFFPQRLFRSEIQVRPNAAHHSEKGTNLFHLSGLIPDKYSKWVPPGIIYPIGFNMFELSIRLHEDLEKLKIAIHHNHEPFIVSVRSGAIFDSPGQLPTVTNVGISLQNIGALAEKIGSLAAWDSLRRFYQEYGEAVYGIPPDNFRSRMNKLKTETQKKSKKEFNDVEMKTLALAYLDEVKIFTKNDDPIPDALNEQILSISHAIALAWERDSVKEYRKAQGMADEPRPAVIIQVMVHGNAKPENSFSGAGVIDAGRWPWASPEGSFELNSTGVDLADSVTMPKKITDYSQELLPIFDSLKDLSRKAQIRLGAEFTIADGHPYILQVRWVYEEEVQPGFMPFSPHDVPILMKATALAGRAAIGPIVHLKTILSVSQFLRENPHALAYLEGANDIFDPVLQSTIEAPSYMSELKTMLANAKRLKNKYRDNQNQVGLIILMEEGHPEQLPDLRIIDFLTNVYGKAVVGWVSEKGGRGSHLHENATRLGINAMAGSTNSQPTEMSQNGNLLFSREGQLIPIPQGTVVSMARKGEQTLIVEGELTFENMAKLGDNIAPTNFSFLLAAPLIIDSADIIFNPLLISMSVSLWIMAALLNLFRINQQPIVPLSLWNINDVHSPSSFAPKNPPIHQSYTLPNLFKRIKTNAYHARQA